MVKEGVKTFISSCFLMMVNKLASDTITIGKGDWWVAVPVVVILAAAFFVISFIIANWFLILMILLLVFFALIGAYFLVAYLEGNRGGIVY